MEYININTNIGLCGFLLDQQSCDDSACENGGSCMVNATGTFCACPNGYGGSPCQRGTVKIRFIWR